MTDDLMLRLRNCYNLLEDEGHYVKANTVHLATATLASVRDITLGTIERLEAELADLKRLFA
jgi:hypothetical protein